MGTLVTDFLLIKPGALHRANGGYLLLDARKLLLSPFAWEALKRAIKAREIRIEQPAEAAGFSPISTQSLDPEPIPLDVRVVLVGDRELYYLLAADDPDFCRALQGAGRFRRHHRPLRRERPRLCPGDRLDRQGARPQAASTRPAVARIIDEGARLADDREKLSIEIGRIADIVREADYWSSQAKRKMTDQAGRGPRHRRADPARRPAARPGAGDDRPRRRAGRHGRQPRSGRSTGCPCIQLGSFAFGRPSRITARVRVGGGRVVDIEREAKLGGPLHSKGVMILWGFLAGRYALDVPLALAATLVFEQSYGGVDGDSASAAELFALLSALSEQPIRQSLAVTGSVNQRGEMQAIGGVNEKIEGFFDVCRARGLERAAGRADPEVERAAPDAARGRGGGRPARPVRHLSRSPPSTRASRS